MRSKTANEFLLYPLMKINSFTTCKDYSLNNHCHANRKAYNIMTALLLLLSLSVLAEAIAILLHTQQQEKTQSCN
jgi:hypothetical protein